MTIPADRISVYRENLKRRLLKPVTKDERAALEVANSEARQVAHILAAQHGVKRVILFGSVARGWPLHLDSDIDLAVEGMTGEDYYYIAADLFSPSGRKIDLVRLEAVRKAFRDVILEQGIGLIDER